MEEHIVTLNKHEDLSDFYTEMESSGGSGSIPTRAVSCLNRRPKSRNTNYNLTTSEASTLKGDSRVRDIISKSQLDTITNKPVYTQTSTDWNKSATAGATNKNWGLYRSIRGSQVSGWGVGGTVAESATINTTSSGKNVDVIIMDGLIGTTHPEFQMYPDGSGGTRVNQFNWLQYKDEIEGGGDGTYTYSSGNSANDNHGMHVAGTVCGNTQGWARDANIYSMSPFDGQINTQYLFEYVKYFHENKSVNAATGRKNPTIVNSSWGSSYSLARSGITQVVHDGVTYNSGFTDSDFNTYGISTRSYNATTLTVAAYVTAYVSDLEDAIGAGVILVAAAGNEQMRWDVSSGDEYNDTVTVSGTAYNYHRGSWNSTGENVICTGAADANSTEKKAEFSDCGPRITTYGPGDNIISAVNGNAVTGGTVTTVDDPRDSDFKLAKYDGTSMASPQVCGALACLLEQEPRLSQSDCVAYLEQHCKSDQLTDSGGSTSDTTSLQGSSNRYLFYFKQRPETGVLDPDSAYGARRYTTAGTKYPRVSTLVTKKS